MKTLKALTISSTVHIAFCLCCIASTVCFALGNHLETDILFGIVILFLGWIINPFGIVSFIINLTIFLIERKQPEHRSLIGKKWIWIFVLPVVTTTLWLASVVLFVQFTGGV